ncbi:hypothetical protein PIB30_091573 [Stylosanthes scabra]|uniref:Uncharacterized protein n=1 Tax=Stylosanthes scabra TaxID=79078 RepID=A0ABU6UTV7_9FABA|nr:hypothetical protein [Stylosanthes scabra]
MDEFLEIKNEPNGEEHVDENEEVHDMEEQDQEHVSPNEVADINKTTKGPPPPPAVPWRTEVIHQCSSKGRAIPRPLASIISAKEIIPKADRAIARPHICTRTTGAHCGADLC